MSSTAPSLEVRIEAALASEYVTAPINSGELAVLIGETMSLLYPASKPMMQGKRADHLREMLVKLQRRHADVVEIETETAWRRNRRA